MTILIKLLQIRIWMLPKTYTVAIVNINVVLALESDKHTGASPAKFLLVFKILFPEATILYSVHLFL